MDPSLVMGTNFWLKFLNGTRLGDFEGFWSETLMVWCSGDTTDFGLGGQQKYVPQSIRRVWGRVMCGFWCFGGLGGRQVA